MQTSLHIKALIAELNREIVGGKITSTEHYKKERTGHLFIKSGSGMWALGVVFHPSGSGTFLVPASKLNIETREKPWPIFSLVGGTVTAVSQPSLDRIFYIDISTSDAPVRLAIEAIGPNSNIWLLDSDSGRRGTLRNRDYVDGDPYNPALPADRIDPTTISIDPLESAIAALGEDGEGMYLPTFLEKKLLGFNKTMAREAARRAECDDVTLGELESTAKGTLVKAVTDMTARFVFDAPGYLYQTPAGVEVYPFKLSVIESQPEKFKTLSFGILELVGRKQALKEEVNERDETLATVAHAIKRLEKRNHRLEADIAEAENFELLKQQAELLQINRHLIKRGMTSLAVENVFVESHPTMEIPLDSSLTPNDNVESYFKRYRKGREGLELLQRRLEISRDELAELRRMADELDRTFESASEKYRAELAALRPGGGEGKGAPQERLPYRPYHLSTGLTIFVGRDGSDNDRTTFDFAKPYELWFHTQQCPGSHVVIKFPNKSFQPSKAEIEETAAIAAFHSKARNDSLVPVIYAERRYVRKPRGAKPGLVTVEREKSVMVAPRKPSEK